MQRMNYVCDTSLTSIASTGTRRFDLGFHSMLQSMTLWHAEINEIENIQTFDDYNDIGLTEPASLPATAASLSSSSMLV